MNRDLDHQLSGLRGRVQSAWSASRAEQVLGAIEERRRKRQQRRRQAALGLGIGCLLLIAPLLFRRLSPSLPPPAPSRAAAVALRFPDGSVASGLSADAEIAELAVEPSRTVLRLLRGSARFQVARNPQRIFRVEAGRTAVEVLGTQFTVSRQADSTRVAVEQGRVRVIWDSHYAELGAGEQGLFPPAERPEPPASSPAPIAPLVPPPRPRSLPPAVRAVAERPSPAAPWRQLAAEGQFDQAYRALSSQASQDLSTAADQPGDLLLLADVARLSHHPALAVAPLEKLLRSHRDDPRAALAAFTLGRILLDDLGQPREAATAFRQAQSLDPSFAMIEQSLAREVQALWRAGDSAAAHARAEEYRQRFPDGSSIRAVRRFGALD
jgi:transmembrane sensor